MSVLGICGLGLIGSSIARAWLPHGEVLGVDPEPQTRAEAAQLGIVTRDEIEELLVCDLLVLAAPTAVNAALLSQLPRDCPTVMDVGSAKAPIVDVWRSNPELPFVASHPMAGSELAGFPAGRADLFVDASWPVVVEAGTDPDALAAVLLLIQQLGARAVPVSAAGHDRAVSTVSHLPHLLAGALGRVLGSHESLAVRLAAGSFRDVTRISGSPPSRTAEFVVANHEQAAARAREAAEALTAAAARLDSVDVGGLTDWLSASHEARAEFESRDTGVITRVALRDVSALRDHLHGVRDSGVEVVGVDLQVSGPVMELLGVVA